jgi:hypothetical protein
MEEQKNNEVIDNAVIEVKKVKKKYDYGDKYKGRYKYDSKKYYDSTYHQEHYLQNKARYQQNGLNRKNKIKEALAMMAKMKEQEIVA